MSTRFPLAAALLAWALALPAQAQNNPLGANPACGPVHEHPDGRSPQSVVQALYEIVSGAAGAKKDWERMLKLFAPGALVMATTHGTAGFLAAPQTPRQFADLNERLLGHRSFYEREIAHEVHAWGHMAHVYSSYETRERPDGPVRVRGVNSFQLLHDGTRWCVLSLAWDAETAAHPIPSRLDRAGP